MFIFGPQSQVLSHEMQSTIVSKLQIKSALIHSIVYTKCLQVRRTQVQALLNNSALDAYFACPCTWLPNYSCPNPLPSNDAHMRHAWSLHKLMGIYMGVLILGIIH